MASPMHKVAPPLDAGFSELIIEGDSVTVMSAVSSSSQNWSRLGVIYDDVRCLVAGLCHVVFLVSKLVSPGCYL